MLKSRIIPTILWEGASSIKGERFNSWRKLGPIIPAVNIYVARNVDEIILLNLSPNKHSSDIDYQSIKKIFQSCNVPLTYGGGIRSMKQVENLLSVGVDKISIGTACYNNEKLIREIVSNFGSQFVVSSIDYRLKNNKFLCHSSNGTFNENITPYDHSLAMQDLGVGEILLTSCDHDGLMKGYELEVLKKLRKSIKIPIIISGGAETLEDFFQGFYCGADAVAASSAFLFSEITPKKIKEYLNNLNICVRL